MQPTELTGMKFLMFEVTKILGMSMKNVKLRLDTKDPLPRSQSMQPKSLPSPLLYYSKRTP